MTNKYIKSKADTTPKYITNSKHGKAHPLGGLSPSIYWFILIQNTTVPPQTTAQNMISVLLLLKHLMMTRTMTPEINSASSIARDIIKILES